MTDDALDEAARHALAALGFTTGTTIANAHGIMTVSMSWHGPHHFMLTVILPGGGRVSGFVPRTKIVRPFPAEEEL